MQQGRPCPCDWCHEGYDLDILMHKSHEKAVLTSLTQTLLIVIVGIVMKRRELFSNRLRVPTSGKRAHLHMQETRGAGHRCHHLCGMYCSGSSDPAVGSSAAAGRELSP
jgi:hypothetical protein